MAISPLNIPTLVGGSTNGYPGYVNTIKNKINELAAAMNISPLTLSATLGAGSPANDLNAMVSKVNAIINAVNSMGGTGGSGQAVGFIAEGDSLTAGAHTSGWTTIRDANYNPLPDPSSNAYPELMVQYLGAGYTLIANEAYSGQTLQQMYDRRARQLDQYLTSANLAAYPGGIYVLVGGGINDMGYGDTPETAYARLKTYCAYVNNLGGKVIPVTPTACGDAERYGTGVTTAQLETKRQTYLGYVRTGISNGELFAQGRIFDHGGVAGFQSPYDITNSGYVTPNTAPAGQPTNGDLQHPNDVGTPVLAHKDAPWFLQMQANTFTAPQPAAATTPQDAYGSNADDSAATLVYRRLFFNNPTPAFASDGWTPYGGSYSNDSTGLLVNANYDVQPKGAYRTGKTYTNGYVRALTDNSAPHLMLKFRVDPSTDRYIGCWSQDVGGGQSIFALAVIQGTQLLYTKSVSAPSDFAGTPYWREIKTIANQDGTTTIEVRFWKTGQSRPTAASLTISTNDCPASGYVGLVSLSGPTTVLKVEAFAL